MSDTTQNDQLAEPAPTSKDVRAVVRAIENDMFGKGLAFGFGFWISGALIGIVVFVAVFVLGIASLLSAGGAGQ